MKTRISLISLLVLCAPAALLAQAPAGAPAPDGISMTPKNGQSNDQQLSDRAACEQWAKGQTGFDAARANGGVAPNEYGWRRDQYARAMTACLEARGYSVQVAAAPAPATPGPAYPAPAYVYRAPTSAPTLKYHPLQVQVDGGFSIPAGDTSTNFDSGPNVGVGLTLFPIPSFPVAIRVDGSYAWFRARDPLLNATNASFGHEEIYGGDADLQVNLGHLGWHSQLYVFGGAGWYRERTTLHQVSLVNGSVCDFYFCGIGDFFAVTGTAQATSPWRHAWNAGLGWEIAVSDYGKFFVEAQYLELLPNNFRQQFVPIRVGFRF